jgi:23S rRNA (guanosine2251-2'-O)-methyltransferase
MRRGRLRLRIFQKLCHSAPHMKERAMRKPFPPKRDGQRRDPPRGDQPRRDPPKFDRQKSDRPKSAQAGRPQRDDKPRFGKPERGERPARGDRSEHTKPPYRGKPNYGGGKPDAQDYGKQERAKPLFRPRKGWRPPVRDRDGPVFLYGWHSVKAALENPARKFHKIMATENALHRLREDGVALPVEPELVRAEIIDALVGPDAVHQGLLVEADPLPSPDISEIPTDGIILVLDQVTDPHNVGAILRTAAAFNVSAVVTTQRHSPEATGVLAKAASGALDIIPMVAVPNLARALDALKNNNVFVIGLDSEGDGDIASVPLRAPLALVIGAEGKGLRQLTRATCDQVARLDLPGKVKSLNVSNATALALYVAASRMAGGA